MKFIIRALIIDSGPEAPIRWSEARIQKKKSKRERKNGNMIDAGAALKNNVC